MITLPMTEHPYPVEVEDRASPTRPPLPTQVRRRLALRAAAVQAELMLERTARGRECVLGVLDDATARWSGERARR